MQWIRGWFGCWPSRVTHGSVSSIMLIQLSACSNIFLFVIVADICGGHGITVLLSLLLLLMYIGHPRRRNVTTSRVGWKKGHICKNLTQNGKPQRYSLGTQKKKKNMHWKIIVAVVIIGDIILGSFVAVVLPIAHSSTPVWGASTKSNGKRRSEMKICGSKRDRNQWPSRFCGGSGARSDTPSGSQHPAPHAKPWPGTHRGRGREAGLATVGGETLKQSWNSKGPTGPEWPEQPRTEYDGGGGGRGGGESLMAYALLGAMGISKFAHCNRIGQFCWCSFCYYKKLRLCREVAVVLWDDDRAAERRKLLVLVLFWNLCWGDGLLVGLLATVNCIGWFILTSLVVC